MAFDDRLLLFLFGCIIGFILGYIVRSLRAIKEELDEVDEIVKEKFPNHTRNEDGIVRHPLVMDLALLLVIVLTVWASFASQKASNDVQETQDQQTRSTLCVQQYLSKTISALNERTTYTQEQAEKNVELQKAQAKFLGLLLHKPPYSEKRRTEAVDRYVDTLTDFVEVSGKASDKVDANPYPTNEELRDCLRAAD